MSGWGLAMYGVGVYALGVAMGLAICRWLGHGLEDRAADPPAPSADELADPRDVAEATRELRERTRRIPGSTGKGGYSRPG